MDVDVIVAPIMDKGGLAVAHASPDVRFATGTLSKDMLHTAGKLEDTALLAREQARVAAREGNHELANALNRQANKDLEDATAWRAQAGELAGTDKDFAYVVQESGEGLGQFVSPAGIHDQFTMGSALGVEDFMKKAMSAKVKMKEGKVAEANALMKEARKLYEAQKAGGLLIGKQIWDESGLVGWDTLLDVTGRQVKNPYWRNTAEVEGTIAIGTGIPEATGKVMVRTLADRKLTFPIHAAVIPTDTKFLLKLEGLVADVKTIIRGNTIRMSTKDVTTLGTQLAKGEETLADLAKQMDEVAETLERNPDNINYLQFLEYQYADLFSYMDDIKKVLSKEEISKLIDDGKALEKLATKFDGQADELLESADAAIANGDDFAANNLRVRAEDNTRQSIVYREIADNAKDAAANLKAKGAGIATVKAAKDALARARSDEDGTTTFNTPSLGDFLNLDFDELSNEEVLQLYKKVTFQWGMPEVSITGYTRGTPQTRGGAPQAREGLGRPEYAGTGRPEYEGTGRLPETLTPFRIEGDAAPERGGRGDGEESITAAITKRAETDGRPVFEGTGRIPEDMRGFDGTTDGTDVPPPRIPPPPETPPPTGRVPEPEPPGRTGRRPVEPPPRIPPVRGEPPRGRPDFIPRITEEARVRPSTPTPKRAHAWWPKKKKTVDRKATPRNRYARTVGWKQGARYGYQDLNTGQTYYSSQPIYNKLPRGKNMRPIDSIRVVRTGPFPPRDREFQVGDTTVRVGKRTITFNPTRGRRG